ncbi:MAG: hydrogenase formation protein HypD [Candidatus Bathyarchaeia archaeon]
MFRFRDRSTASNILERIRNLNVKARFMNVCGTHQDTIVRYSLDTLLEPYGIELIAGPGCPICVTTAREYMEAIALAMKGKIVATYGDAARVRIRGKSLLSLRGEGADVRIVYSIDDAVDVAVKNPGKDIVFLAVGFETTAPATAYTILSDPPKNFYILSCHRRIPPAIEALLSLGETRIDGFIDPGHVSTIIGVEPYERIVSRFPIPHVISGFEPLDVLVSVYMLARQVRRGEAKVENEYSRAVRRGGNPKALKFIEEVFETIDLEWRGLSKVESSGMRLRRRYEDREARLVFQDELESHGDYDEPKGCLCSEVLRGLVKPRSCPLFSSICTPLNPIGPCMVSVEGACYIEYKHRRG